MSALPPALLEALIPCLIQSCGAQHTLSLLVCLSKTAFCDPASLIVESLGAGHARGCGARAASRGRASCTSGTRATRRASGVPEPIGIVARSSVHGVVGATGVNKLARACMHASKGKGCCEARLYAPIVHSSVVAMGRNVLGMRVAGRNRSTMVREFSPLICPTWREACFGPKGETRIDCGRRIKESSRSVSLRNAES